MSREPRRGLGRGLDALISSESSTSDGVTMAAVDNLEPNPLQPRSEWDEERLRELADSIREHGVIQPLIVTRGVGRKEYQIVAGERRWRAAKLAKLSEIPVLVRDFSSMQALEIALVENVQRADLNPVEEALAFRQLMTEFGLTQEQVAERVGKSRSAVANTVRLLDAPEEIRAAVLQGKISAGHARALLGAGSRDRMLELFQLVVQKGLSVRQTERLAAASEKPTPSEPKRQVQSELTPDERAVEHQLQHYFGTQVNFQKDADGGRIVIHYYSDEELNEILRRINGLEEQD